MAATLLLRNPPSYLGAASQQHSARNDRLTLGTVFRPAAGSATATPLAVVGGALIGPAGTMGEVTLTSPTLVTINPARWVVMGGIDSKQGQYECTNDQQNTLAVTAQDASLYRRSYLAVVVDDSESSGVASSATTDRGSVQVIDGALAASAPAYPDLTAYPNRLLLGEFYIPPTGQTVTWTPYNPRTALRGAILPVVDDALTYAGHGAEPGVFDGQYRDRGHLERWSVSAADWLPSPHVRRCLSTARPANPRLGQIIFETDTLFERRWDGTYWEILRWTGQYTGGAYATGVMTASNPQQPAMAANWTNATIANGVSTAYSGWTSVTALPAAFATAGEGGVPLFQYVNAAGQTFRVNAKCTIRATVNCSSDMGYAGRSSLSLLTGRFNGIYNNFVDTRQRNVGYSGAGFLEQFIDIIVHCLPGDTFGTQVYQTNSNSGPCPYNNWSQVMIATG